MIRTWGIGFNREKYYFYRGWIIKCTTGCMLCICYVSVNSLFFNPRFRILVSFSIWFALVNVVLRHGNLNWRIIVVLVSVRTSSDVPRSLVVCLLCQGLVWQLHEEHDNAAGEAVWHPQLSDRRHRRELWNWWVYSVWTGVSLSQATCVQYMFWLLTKGTARTLLSARWPDTSACVHPVKPLSHWVTSNWLLTGVKSL